MVTVGMAAYALPAAFALVLWWASTALIIYLDGLPRRTFRWSMAGASALCLAAFAALALDAGGGGLAGAYVSFTAALVIWGWQLVGFYMGYVTGPRKDACPPGLSGAARFIEALRTSLWHELAGLAGAGVIYWIARDQPGHIGFWTYVILWWMHMSAKLNIFLGVPNLGEELLPEHLAYLSSYMRRRAMNLLFPVSVTLSTLAAAVLAWKAAVASAPGEAAGLTMLGVLMALAILEHWLLVLPVSMNGLWQWGLKSHEASRADDNGVKGGTSFPSALGKVSGGA